MASHNILSYLFLLTFMAIQVAQSTRRVERQATSTGGYPTYSSIPDGLSFSCVARIPGYYADTETDCQVWHWCHPDGQIYSFLCPSQTRFNQIYRACDWHYNVDCPASPDFYKINEDLHKIPVPSNGDNETQSTLMLPKTDLVPVCASSCIGDSQVEGTCVSAGAESPDFTRIDTSANCIGDCECWVPLYEAPILSAINRVPCKPNHVFDNSEDKCVRAYKPKPVFVRG